MNVDLFDFELPDDRIALHPAAPRDSAKMLVVEGKGTFDDRVVNQLPALLAPGDLLVVNDTRVIPAELSGVRYRKEYEAKVGVNLHMRVNTRTWRAFARPLKRLKRGDRIVFDDEANGLAARVEAVDSGEVTLTFDQAGAVLDEAIKARGAMPLPPYIGAKRAIEARDAEDYQTVYASQDGAVAAPTAGLHFTDALLAGLKARGIGIVTVTLHVGAGTFLPMKVQDTDDHVMHAEWGVVTPDAVAAIEETKAAGGRVVAVGTTSLRLLESAARETGQLAPFTGETDIFITPGFRFRVVDILMTNFHLPRSTLFMLVSAFCGRERMLAAYRHAIENRYRFYSYGDSSLLFRTEAP